MYHFPVRQVHSVQRTAAARSLAGAGARSDAGKLTRSRPPSVARLFLLLVAFATAVLASSAALADAGVQSQSCKPASGSSSTVCSTATLAKGQQQIDQAHYEDAIATFTCILTADPLVIDAYRGRVEAKLMLGRYSDAFQDYSRLTAVVLPVYPDAGDTVLASYDARLAAHPWNVAVLTGASFARWWQFDYSGSLPLLNRLLTLNPFNVYANLFRGSSRLLGGVNQAAGENDFTRAIQLAPSSAHVRYIVADGYTYGLSNPQRAFSEASLALQWGLDTPRVHAILASADLAFGNLSDAAYHFQRHIDLVTTDATDTDALAIGDEMTLDLAAGLTYEIPVAAIAGQKIHIETSSPSGEIGDTILVLLAPNGTPVTGNDDYIDYFAGLDWTAPATGTYLLRVTSFEGVSTGEMVVSRN